MRRRLIETLEAVIAAENLACELRKSHGQAAEKVCDALIAEAQIGKGEREVLRDVRRALRWL
jgi:hypothetical protein